jgi:hypothetical protein
VQHDAATLGHRSLCSNGHSHRSERRKHFVRDHLLMNRRLRSRNRPIHALDLENSDRRTVRCSVLPSCI